MCDVYADAWCFRFSQIMKPRRHLLRPYPYTPRKEHSSSLGRTPICSSSQKIVLCQTEYQTLCTVYNRKTSNEKYPSTVGRRHLLWSMQAMARSRVEGSPASQHWECALHTLSNQSVKKFDLEDQHPSSISVQSDGLCAN